MNNESQNYYQDSYQNNYQSNPQNNQNVDDKGSFGWAVLGFFFPLIGLILFLVWKSNKPKSAKKAGIGALVGFILSILSIFLLPTLFYGLMWGNVANNIADSNCKTAYGKEYEAVLTNNTYYCKNTQTGETFKLE